VNGSKHSAEPLLASRFGLVCPTSSAGPDPPARESVGDERYLPRELCCRWFVAGP
jgi:hypothetical protein